MTWTDTLKTDCTSCGKVCPSMVERMCNDCYEVFCDRPECSSGPDYYMVCAKCAAPKTDTQPPGGPGPGPFG